MEEITQSGGTPPKNYLVESILVTIFCCLPLGIAGIVNASKVNSAYENGDFATANKAAADAKKWCKWGLIAGIAFLVVYGIAMAVGFSSGALDSGF